jgi:hypothetical protein
MRKKRGYKRTHSGLKRDYRLFAIACEGGKREADYFQLLESLSQRITIDIIEDKVPDAEMRTKYETKSAPKRLLDRAVKYIEKEGLIDEDELWFVMDIDKWEINQIREIAELCEMNPNWHIAISNPCFEIWLYFHMVSTIPDEVKENCKKAKNKLATLTDNGYNKNEYIIKIADAIKNSKNVDNNKHFLPNNGETKVYLLAESLINYVGVNDFNRFIEMMKK